MKCSNNIRDINLFAFFNEYYRNQDTVCIHFPRKIGNVISIIGTLLGFTFLSLYSACAMGEVRENFTIISVLSRRLIRRIVTLPD